MRVTISPAVLAAVFIYSSSLSANCPVQSNTVNESEFTDTTQLHQNTETSASDLVNTNTAYDEINTGVGNGNDAVTLEECAGADKFNNDVSSASNIDPNKQSNANIVRLLQQSTFGPSVELIRRIRRIGQQAWIDEQLRLPYNAGSHTDYVRRHSSNATYASHIPWWDDAIASPAQLRHRVAYALSQIMVVSSKTAALSSPLFTASYNDMLNRNALGNFRDLLGEMTLHPAMGIFLSSHYNSKENLVTNTRPDENFARELMQLFTIGINRLNLDGSVMRDGSGEPIRTYTQDDIKEFARVFTGLYDVSANYWLQNHGVNPTAPMIAYDLEHDTGIKTFFRGTDLEATIPGHANTTGSTMTDIERTLDIIFNHPNVAPFVSRQLIQRLVTSNPSASYIRRVARVFENNGKGVRGDLGAVTKAILLDAQARGQGSGVAAFGKVKEPIIVFTSVIRALGSIPAGPIHSLRSNGSVDQSERHYVSLASGIRFGYNNLTELINQAPLSAASVFNFYMPDHKPGGEFIDEALIFPELQIATDSMWIDAFNIFDFIFSANLNNLDNPQITYANPGNALVFDLTDERELLINRGVGDLIYRLNLVMYANSMTQGVKQALRSELQRALNAHERGDQRSFNRYLRNSLMAISAAPHFWVQQ